MNHFAQEADSLFSEHKPGCYKYSVHHSPDRKLPANAFQFQLIEANKSGTERPQLNSKSENWVWDLHRRGIGHSWSCADIL